MRGWVGAWAVGAMVVCGCGSMGEPPAPGDETQTEPPSDERQVPPPETPADDPVAETPPDTTPEPDTQPQPEPPVVKVGPWPNEPLVNYSQRYALGGVRAMSVDDGYNLWLLDGERIGVLRPGDSAPTWTTGVGQAAGGFGEDKLAMGSTVICGGSAGRAYVGYFTYELANAFIFSPEGSEFPAYNNPDPARYDPVRREEYKKGDMDVVKLEGSGTVALEEHLGRNNRRGSKNGDNWMGLRNSNDYHFDEDRSVLSCTKVMRGTHKGELYIGTNHGVTRVQGLTFNSHRHPIWKEKLPDGKESQRAGYTYGLGIAQNGDVLIANDWMLGIVTPSTEVMDWENTSQSANPEKLSAHLMGLNTLEEKDFWRGFQQTPDGRYYVASKDFGLWRVEAPRRSDALGTKVSGLPTDVLSSLAATDDGSLFIGTQGFGLWRMDASKRLSFVDGVDGANVRQLFYDPTVKPAMLYVLTNSGLTVLRGH